MSTAFAQFFSVVTKNVQFAGGKNIGNELQFYSCL